ncbi:hypothetical protein LCGC14_2850600 [marine sediment metagenome]|uniref:Uncharacterized protein n=1 Tax=marine sediment metagenome TaxID=412755 RepID=A0A0F9AGR9_9ZZZZ
MDKIEEEEGTLMCYVLVFVYALLLTIFSIIGLGYFVR